MKFINNIVAVIILLLLTSFTASSQAAGDAKTLVIAGAGPSTEIINLLAKEFHTAHKEYKIIVPPKSIKHKGGLKWATKSNRLFGRTDRPLSEKDRKEFPALMELLVARIKTSFAVSKELGVSKLTLEQWSNIYKGTVQNWQEAGGSDVRIIRLGREPGEALLTGIQSKYPFFGKRGFLKEYKKEDHMLKSIGKIPGAIGFSSKSSLALRKELTVLDIKGFNMGLAVGLVYDIKDKDAETVTLMKTFVQSDRWRKTLEEHDFLPVNGKPALQPADVTP
ncbi:MAG: hypothetical protein GY862_14800 [Gammaproteobacteria bacterium]|nr:hypothetical protein [Gammaproteobacteria bacterium]